MNPTVAIQIAEVSINLAKIVYPAIQKYREGYRDAGMTKEYENILQKQIALASWVASADGGISTAALDTISTCFGIESSISLRETIRQILSNTILPNDLASHFVFYDEKSYLFKALCTIAFADGVFSENETERLAIIQEALGLQDTEAEAIFAEVTSAYALAVANEEPALSRLNIARDTFLKKMKNSQKIIGQVAAHIDYGLVIDNLESKIPPK